MGHRPASRGAGSHRRLPARVIDLVMLGALLPAAAAGSVAFAAGASAAPAPTATAAVAGATAPGGTPSARPRPTPTATPTPVRAAPPPSAGSSRGGSPSDGSQWYHESLRLADAHRVTRGEGVVVAIIDGGVDAAHPKLAGQVLPGAGVGADAAPDGLRDDDPDGHGTAMAGIVAARADGGDPAVWGVAPGAKILPISSGEEADSEEVARSVRIAVDRGADVVSMSLGSAGAATSSEESAVAYALAHDVVVVASAGNTEAGDREVNSPANIPGVLAVTGSDFRGLFWGGSVQGPEAVLAAPGPGVRAPVPTRISPDGLDTGGGTSNSAAIVAGVAALVRAEMPELDAPNVINRLIRTAIDMGPLGRDDQYGFGLVDPVAALTVTLPLVSTNPLLDVPAPRGDASAGGASTGGTGTGGTGTGGTGTGGTGTGGTGTGGATELSPDPLPPTPTTADGHGEDTGANNVDGDPSTAGWIAGLGSAVLGGVLLGFLAHQLFGGRFGALLRRSRGTVPPPAWSPFAAASGTPYPPPPAGSMPPAGSVPPPAGAGAMWAPDQQPADPFAPSRPGWADGQWRTPH